LIIKPNIEMTRFSAILFVVVSFAAAAQTVQERLGYPADTKLLIIHGDDIGVSHSQNEATFKAFEKGIVSSGSIMVPCPWLPEVGVYAKAHPAHDMGLHLTLTAEWRDYKWGGVTDRSEAPTLVDGKNFFPDNSEAVTKNAKVAEVEEELRAQIERAKQFGIDPTHFDSHMGSLFGSPDLLKLYIRLGHEYKVPVMLHDQFAKPLLGAEYNTLITKNDVVTDMIYMAYPENYKTGMKTFYTGVINGMKPGLNVILIHLAFDESEMRAVTVDHPDYGAAWRQADYDFFTSDECKKLLKDNKIKVITWREVRDKITRR
jgi:chitin disaccharide deacetylase